MVQPRTAIVTLDYERGRFDDLLHWTKYGGNPLFPEAENKSSGILVHDGRKSRMYTMHSVVHVHVHGND